MSENCIDDCLRGEVSDLDHGASYQRRFKIVIIRYSPVTGDLSPLVNFSFLTNLLKTDEVNEHALRTADIATSLSMAYNRDISIQMAESKNTLPRCFVYIEVVNGVF